MIVPTHPEPFFDSNNRQQFDNGKPLSLAGSYAHYANYRLAARLNLVPDHGPAQSFSPSQLQQIAHDVSQLPAERLLKAVRGLDAETRAMQADAIAVELGKATGTAPKLDSEHLSSPLLLSEQTYLYSLFKSGEMVFRIDRTKSADGGIIQPLGTAQASLQIATEAETFADAQARGMREKIGIQSMSVYSLGQLPVNGNVEFMPVETDAAPLPGLKMSLRHVGFIHVIPPLNHIVKKMTVGPDVLGLALLDKSQIGLLINGETPWLRFLKSRDDNARKIVEDAREHYGTSWEEISVGQLGDFVSTRKAIVSQDRSGVDTTLDIDSLIASKADFQHGHDQLATSLQIMRKLGGRQSLVEVAYIQKAIEAGQAVRNLVEGLEEIKPTKYPRGIAFVR